MKRTRAPHGERARKATTYADDGTPITTEVRGTSTDARLTVLVNGVLVARQRFTGQGALGRAIEAVA